MYKRQLHALGGAPVVMATLGNDGGDYLARLTGWGVDTSLAVSYTHLRAHETVLDLVCRLLLEKKKQHETRQ